MAPTNYNDRSEKEKITKEDVKMIKYIARQVPPEDQEPDLFYIRKDGRWMWEDEYWNNISILPRSGFHHVLTDDVQEVLDVLESYAVSADVSASDDVRASVEHNLPARRENGAPYTPEEIKLLYNMASAYNDNPYDNRTIISSVLSIMTGKKYDWQCLHGCSQNDWRYIVYPSALYSKDDIRYFECALFNTGTEWSVADASDPYDVSPIYCTGYNDDIIRREIADGVGCLPEEIEMYKFTGYTRTANYEKI